MAKTIMDMTPQVLLKMFVNDVGELIDARIRTAEITIKANTDAAIKTSEERVKSELRQEIKASEERITSELQQDIKASETSIRKDMATKEDAQQLEQKLDKK